MKLPYWITDLFSPPTLEELTKRKLAEDERKELQDDHFILKWACDAIVGYPPDAIETIWYREEKGTARKRKAARYGERRFVCSASTTALVLVPVSYVECKDDTVTYVTRAGEMSIWETRDLDLYLKRAS